MEGKIQELETALRATRKELEIKIKHYEGKLLTMSVINGALQSENDQLKDAVNEIGDGSVENELRQELDDLQKEFTTRLGTAQKQTNSMREECVGLRKEVASLKAANKELTEKLEEKDKLIKQFSGEGENLLKKNLELEATIRKLKADAGKSEQENERLQARVQVLEAAAKSEESTKSKALEEANQTVTTLRQTMAEQKEYFTKLLEEVKAEKMKEMEHIREESIEITHKSSKEMMQREVALAASLESMRQCVELTNQEASKREDALRSEVTQLESRLRDAELAREEAVSRLSDATRPLIRQIESLNFQLTRQDSSTQQRCLDLERQLAESQLARSAAEEAQTCSETAMKSLQLRVDAAEKSEADAKMAVTGIKSRLEEAVETCKSLREECVSSMERAHAAEEGQRAAMEALGRAARDKEELQRQFKALKVEKEGEIDEWKCKYNEQASNKDERTSGQEKRPSSEEQTPVTSKGSEIEGWLEDAVGSEASRSHGVNGGRESKAFLGFGFSQSRGGNAVSMERLSAKVKQQAGEISQLQNELSSARASANHATGELLKASEKLLQIQKDEKRLASLEQQFSELQKRHETALMIIGERNERADELEADLADVKALYREQMNLLISEIDPEKWPSGYRICLFCSHCAQTQRGRKRG